MRRLADKLAAWFGYVRITPTASRCECGFARVCECEELPENFTGKSVPLTQTAVKPRPEIILSTRVNKGVPCS